MSYKAIFSCDKCKVETEDALLNKVAFGRMKYGSEYASPEEVKDLCKECYAKYCNVFSAFLS